VSRDLANRRERPSRRWLINNVSLVVISLALAFFFWAVATEAEDPTDTRPFSPMAPVEIRGLPEGMTTYGAENARVRVEIMAPRSVWERLQADDIHAYVDLSSVHTGTIQVPVQVIVDLEPSTVVNVTPGEIPLTVERIAEKDVQVAVRVEGNPAMGFTARAHEVAPESVRVRGPESKVNQVVEALVSVSVADRQSDLRSDIEPVPVDEDEAEVTMVEIVPRSVTVHVPLTQWLDTRNVPVNLTLVGQPAPGYRIADLDYEPQSLTVYGRADVLDATTALQTDPVDLGGITRTLQSTVSLRLPTGLFVFTAQNTVSITVTVEPIRSGLNLEVTPTVSGLRPNLSATVGLDTIIVILSGPLLAMEDLDVGTVEAILDLTAYTSGEYLITPRIIVPNEIKIENITPQAVPVRIEVVPTPIPEP
jgi:YbbR domain-containing protein